MDKKVALLLGSGVSYASGAASVETITQKTLGSLITSDERSRRAQDLMKILFQQIKPHIRLRENREPHYEDLYYCLVQMRQDLDGDVMSPMIEGSLHRFMDATTHLYTSESTQSQEAFRGLLEAAIGLIEKTTFDLLSGPDSPKGFGLISKLARYTRDLDIYSMNHDLLIERQLQDECICYYDGFPKAKTLGDAYQYQGVWDNTQSSVKLFKLHGSIDWYLVETTNESKTQKMYVRMENPLEKRKDAHGKPFVNTRHSAVFLSGSVVKEQAYGLALIGELFEQFRKRSRDRQVIIASGYGWSDRGINQRVEQWLRDDERHKLIILHNESQGQKVKDYRFWKTWKGASLIGSRVIILQKWLSETKIEDLEPFI